MKITVNLVKNFVIIQCVYGGGRMEALSENLASSNGRIMEIEKKLKRTSWSEFIHHGTSSRHSNGSLPRLTMTTSQTCPITTRLMSFAFNYLDELLSLWHHILTYFEYIMFSFFFVNGIHFLHLHSSQKDVREKLTFLYRVALSRRCRQRTVAGHEIDVYKRHRMKCRGPKFRQNNDGLELIQYVLDTIKQAFAKGKW